MSPSHWSTRAARPYLQQHTGLPINCWSRAPSSPLALRILGEDGEGLVGEAVEWPHSRRVRLFIAARTLAFIAALPGGASVVFDYGEPTQMLSPEARSVRDEFARRVADLGEPWVTFFDPAELHGRLRALGFGEIEDHPGTKIVAQYLSVASTSAAGGAHVVRATSFLS